jgi:cytochrome P450
VTEHTGTTIASADPLLSLPPAFWDPHSVPYFDAARGTWHVFSYADVTRVLSDGRAFSQTYGDPDVHPNWAVMWAADDPRHADLRAIVSEPFTQSVLRGLAPRIEAIVEELIDRIVEAGSGRFEAVGALAKPLATRVICEIMGVDLADDARFARWVDEITSTPTFDLPAQPDMVAYFGDLLAERRARPDAGLVDKLIAAQRSGHLIAGQALIDRDLIGYLWGLLAAGSDTTATGLVNMLLFLSHYGHIAQLEADRDLVPGAIEESLRWYPPFPAVMGMANTDVRFGSHPVKAGEMATGWMTAANRDPAEFSDPDSFDISRKPNPHLAFAKGGHHCLGAPLARLELRIALRGVLDRLPGLRWDRDRPFKRTLGIVNRVEEAHFSFGPGGLAPASG